MKGAQMLARSFNCCWPHCCLSSTQPTSREPLLPSAEGVRVTAGLLDAAAACCCLLRSSSAACISSCASRCCLAVSSVI